MGPTRGGGPLKSILIRNTLAGTWLAGTWLGLLLGLLLGLWLERLVGQS